MLRRPKGELITFRFFLSLKIVVIEIRNPNGDATPATKNSIDLDSLRRLGTNVNIHYTESLPAPSLLSSSTSEAASVVLTSSQPQESSDHLSSVHTNSNSPSDVDVVKPEGGINLGVTQQQQSAFIHHALSSAKNRHRRSLTMSSSNFRRRLINKRLIVKRNFPNNQLSKASAESDMDDSNEKGFDGNDEEESDDSAERELEEDGKVVEKQESVLNTRDRLDDDDNENDLEKSMKLFVPYWDAYDTVNQLFLELSEYCSVFIYLWSSHDDLSFIKTATKS